MYVAATAEDFGDLEAIRFHVDPLPLLNRDVDWPESSTRTASLELSPPILPVPAFSASYQLALGTAYLDRAPCSVIHLALLGR